MVTADGFRRLSDDEAGEFARAVIERAHAVAGWPRPLSSSC